VQIHHEKWENALCAAHQRKLWLHRMAPFGTTCSSPDKYFTDTFETIVEHFSSPAVCFAGELKLSQMPITGIRTWKMLAPSPLWH